MTRKTPTVTVGLTGGAEAAAAPEAAEATAEGWTLKVTKQGEGNYSAVLTGPKRGDGTDMHRWPSMARVFETVFGYLRARGLSHVAFALRTSIEGRLK